MRYWWVNQNQTYRHEIGGGYLWSPKRKKDGHRNPFYEFMREISPGDLIFSFADTWVRAFGIAQSNAFEAPKPEEFGGAGRNWSHIGWRVDVSFHEVAKGFRPVDWIDRLRPLLSNRYAPLLPDGRGVQSIYLTEIREPLALTLAELLGVEALAFARSEVVDKLIVAPSAELVMWEEHLAKTIESDELVQPTEKEALILARRGQGLFRRRVAEVEARCRVTGVDRPEHLRASHCKPWRDCDNNAERLNGENGLMLTPSIDHLFDRGFISFEDDGRLLVSPVAHRPSLHRMGVNVEKEHNVGPFRSGQGRFLAFHRDSVFLRSAVAL